MVREYKELTDSKSIAGRMGIKQKAEIPPEELDLKIREDRIGRYFTKYLNKFLFAEFSEEFLSDFKAADIMRGVPIPLRKQDIKEFNGGKGLSMLHIAENMAWVIGCDPHFKYTQDYVDCMIELFGSKIIEGLLKEGRDAAEMEDYDNACIHFRACLCMQPNYLHGMYSYARACTKMYEQSNNREFIGRMKAEAMEFYELVTIIHPRHANSYYFLGYAYLNMGHYVKARLAWQDFLRMTRNNKDRKEIRKRIEQINDPVLIEEGYNAIMAGRNEEGIEKLEHFTSGEYSKWWPLYYYLGVGYERTGKVDKAVESFKYALKLNGSHLETMEELYAIYMSRGDEQNATKYRKKMGIIRKQLEAEQEQLAKEEADTSSGLKESDFLDKETPLPPEERMLKKMEQVRAERMQDADSELEEAMRKRAKETKTVKRPTKRLR